MNDLCARTGPTRRAAHRILSGSRGGAWCTRAEKLGALQVLEGASSLLQGDVHNAHDKISEARTFLKPGTDRWVLAIGTLAYTSSIAGAPTAAVELADAIQSLPQSPIHNARHGPKAAVEFDPLRCLRALSTSIVCTSTARTEWFDPLRRVRRNLFDLRRAAVIQNRERIHRSIQEAA